VTNTADIHLFVWFAFFSAALIYLPVPYWLTIPILLTASIYGLHIIFYEGSFFALEGGWQTIKLFASEFWYNSGLIFSGEFTHLTDPFRTFLLFMLLALICYLLYFWIFQTRRSFMFLLSTVIYITVLDTFTPIDASAAIVRIVIIGFFILTLLHMLKIQEQEMVIGKRVSSFTSPFWMYTLIFMIGVATFVGVVAPKPEPQWSDPVPSMRTFVLGESSGNGSGTRRVGYGENDERLGGGFIQDNNLVFRAETSAASYWRGESKHEYTGQGWVSEPMYVESNYIFGDEIDYYMYEDLAEVDELKVTIEMEEGVGFPHFFYPGQLKQVDLERLSYLVDGNDGDVNELTFNTDRIGGRVEASSRLGDPKLTSYDLVYDEPTFPIEALRGTDENDPDELKELFLQLPDDLPDRVGDLADEIVKEENNRYDKVKAIEQYFSENGFEYQTTNVPVPDEGEDYVDQFLFETQLGYCDNYSTSMAVMLRSLDIPTRWVKGFTSGEEVDETDEGLLIYEISNANAHSWVEVYFPGVGWVPFEPTQGFDNYAEFEEEEVEIDLDLDNGTDEDIERPDMGPDDGLFPDMDEDLAGATGQTGSSMSEYRAQLTEYFTPKVFLISIVVFVMLMVIYEKQNRLQNHYFLWHYRLFGQDQRYTVAYRRLLWILANEGLPRAEGETLREYAKRMDSALSSQSMTKLTKLYEKIYYGGYEPEGDWAQLQKDWEEIINLLNA